jgi:hypothetical protein
MSSLKPQRTRSGVTAILALLLTLTLATASSAAGQTHARSSSPRHGELHATKDCSKDTGKAGGFCTITDSNLRQISRGSRVFYLEPEGATGLDSDLVLYAGPGNVALGHVTLSFADFTGWVTLTPGTGRFRDFHARVRVTLDQSTNLWHWDGTYHLG